MKNEVVKQRNGRGYSYNFELNDAEIAKHGNLFAKAKISVYFDTGAKAEKEGGYERESGYRLAIRPYDYLLKDSGISYYSSVSFMLRQGSKFGQTILDKLAKQVDFENIAKLYANVQYVDIANTLSDVEA